jgi:hypothetical protein
MVITSYRVGANGVAGPAPARLTLGLAEALSSCRSDSMYWFGVLFAFIGAALILGALTYVSLLIGVLIHFMIILLSGPLIDRFLARRRRQS